MLIVMALVKNVQVVYLESKQHDLRKILVDNQKILVLNHHYENIEKKLIAQLIIKSLRCSNPC